MELVKHKHTQTTQYSAHDYIREAHAKNTHKAFRNDMDHFIAWGGSIPCSPEVLTQYLSYHASILSVATLKRRIATIGKAHRLSGYTPSPTQSEAVKMTLKGIQRHHGLAQKQAAPLTRDDLISITSQMPNTMKGLRDKTLLLIGFAGALRRSEIVGINIENITMNQQGAILHIRHSKTDRTGQGRKVPIPYARGRVCPVQALEKWIKARNTDAGPLFVSIRKGGNPTNQRLSDRAVSTLIKSHVKDAQMQPDDYSGHSLRAGFCTTAAQKGIPEWKIMRQTGHKSHQTLIRYIRDGRLFADSAVLGMF